MLHFDGTKLEGGGQLVRIVLGLSSLTGTPIHITDIRGKRSGGGGLKAQHLTAVKWLAGACGATIEGASLGSRELKFTPNGSIGGSRSLRHGGGVVNHIPFTVSESSASSHAQPDGQDENSKEEQIAAEASGSPRRRRKKRLIKIEQPTNGSIGLVLQAILPYLLFSSPFSSSGDEASADSQDDSEFPSSFDVEIIGGTNVPLSPSFDYIQQVLFPMLELIGLSTRLTATLQRRGWCTGTERGLGRATFTMTPLRPGSSLPGFVLRDRGQLVRIDISVIAPGGSNPGAHGAFPGTNKSKKGKKGSKPRRSVKKGKNIVVQEAEYEEQEQEIESGPKDILLRLLLRILSTSFPGVETRIVLDEDSRRGSNNSKGGVYVLLVAQTTTGYRLGRDFLSDRKLPSSGATSKDKEPSDDLEEALMKIGSRVVKDLERDLGRHMQQPVRDDEKHSSWVVDEHLQDQLVVFQALAKGRSVVGHEVQGHNATPSVPRAAAPKATLHTQTAQWVTGRLLGARWGGERTTRARAAENGNEENTSAQKASDGESVEEGTTCEGIGFVVGQGPSFGLSHSSAAISRSAWIPDQESEDEKGVEKGLETLAIG